MPAGLVSARIGGVLEIVRSRLRTGNEGELAALAPDIVNLAIADRPPPEPLRLSVRTPKAKPESLDAADHSERAIRAFALLCAERGYPNVKVDDILRLASMSPTTFYANFSGREDLLAAAIDQACAQAVAAVVPAFNRHDSLPDAIRAGFGALLNFLASRPALTKLVTVEVYAAGDAAIERRIEGLAPLSALLVNNTTMWSSTPPIVYEMISGGVAHLLHDTVRNDGPQALPALAPLCTYLSLSPFLGPEESCAAANGDGGRRSTEEREDSSGPAQPFGAKAVSYDEVMNSVSWRVMAMLAGRDKTAAELAIEAGVDEELIVKYLNRLHAAGEIESTGVRDGKNLYRTAPMHPLNVASTQQMASLTPDERDERLISIWRMMRIELDVAASGGFLRDRPDTFLTRTPMWVDDEGWLELQELHGQTLKAGMEIAKRNRERLEESGGRRFEIQSFQAAFEVPELPTWLPRPDEPGAE